MKIIDYIDKMFKILIIWYLDIHIKIMKRKISKINKELGIIDFDELNNEFGLK